MYAVLLLLLLLFVNALAMQHMICHVFHKIKFLEEPSTILKILQTTFTSSEVSGRTPQKWQEPLMVPLSCMSPQTPGVFFHEINTPQL